MEFGESFFTEELKIPKEEIIDFIDFCNSKGIIGLYLKNQKIEVIDIMIKESKSYTKNNKSD